MIKTSKKKLDGRASFYFKDKNQHLFRGRDGFNTARVNANAHAYNQKLNKFLYGAKQVSSGTLPLSQTEFAEKVAKLQYNKEGLIFIKKLLGKLYKPPKRFSKKNSSKRIPSKSTRKVGLRKISQAKRIPSKSTRKVGLRKISQETSQQWTRTPKVQPSQIQERENNVKHLKLKKMLTKIRPDEMWIAQKSKKAERKKRAKGLQRKSQMPKTEAAPSKTSALSGPLSTQKKNVVPRRHAYIKVESSQRLNTLLTLLKAMQQDKRKLVIIVNFASSVKFYEELLQRMDSKSDILFLSKRTPRNEAPTTMETFETSQSATLFCTPSIAAKLNIKGPHSFIQYDPPLKVQRYISRLKKVGETKTGKTLLFLHPKEAEFVNELQSADIPITEYIPQWVQPITFQKKLDLLMKTFYVVYLSALDAYRDFLKSYKLMDSEFLKLSNLSIKEVGRSFGFDIPPFVKLDEDANVKRKREMDEKKESTKKRRRNIKPEKVYVHIR